MNIFFLDSDIRKCAEAHCDKHVVKMILEYTQILCTVVWKAGLEAPYQPTHKNHPCVIWAAESLDNWLWLKSLCAALNNEYRFRFEKVVNHKSFDVASDLPLPPLPRLGITERPQTMPVALRVPGAPIQAYRKYYLTEKAEILSWTKRALPGWVTKEL